MSGQRPLIGIGIVVTAQGMVLLGQRKNSHGCGQWAFPGGHLEFGETPQQCAQRELYEETSLVAHSIFPGPWTNNMIGNDKHYVTLFMFVSAFSGTLKVMEPQKCELWEWFLWEKLPAPLFPTIESFMQLPEKNRPAP